MSPVAPPVERSGRGVRIALIDSGVDTLHPVFAGADLTHVRIVQKGALFALEPGEPVDSSGHGTACAGIIRGLVPEAALVSVCAFGPDGRCSREGLVAALRWCVAQRFGVVNLSLGVDVPKGAPLRPNDFKSIVDLYEMSDAAYTAQVVLVASGPNVASFRTYPGRAKSLIGVGRASFSDPERIGTELTADYELVAPGTDVSAPAVGGGERRWTGTSFAVPHVAAHVARIRAARPALSVEAVKGALHQLAAAQAAAAEAQSHATA